MDYAALVTWVVTAGLGFFMLTTWATNGGLRDASDASHFRPPVVLGHFLLAAAGLVVWLVYLVNDAAALAWIAFADLVVVAGIGDTLVLRWYRDRSGATSPARRTGRAGRGAGGTMTDPVAGHATTLAEQRIPPAVVAAHGVFAVATLVLVLLTALGVGG